MNLEFELNVEAKRIVEKYLYTPITIQTLSSICGNMNFFIRKHEQIGNINPRQSIKFLIKNNEIVIEYYSLNDYYQNRHCNIVGSGQYLNFDLPIDL